MNLESREYTSLCDQLQHIRYVLSRRKSLSRYTQEDIVLLANHFNSTRRSKLGGKTPFELADGVEFRKLKRSNETRGNTGRRGGSDASIAE